MQGTLFAQQCVDGFPGMATLVLPENYRSVRSVVAASRCVLGSTQGGSLSVPQAMRHQDIQPLFPVSRDFPVRAIHHRLRYRNCCHFVFDARPDSARAGVGIKSLHFRHMREVPTCHIFRPGADIRNNAVSRVLSIDAYAHSLRQSAQAVVAQLWPPESLRKRTCAQSQAEAHNIRQLVGQLLHAGHPADEIAVLYPGHRYGDLIEEALLGGNVPVQRYGRNSIAERCGARAIATASGGPNALQPPLAGK